MYVPILYIPYSRNYYPQFLVFFHFIICQLFFDDRQHFFEMVRLQNKSGYYKRAVIFERVQ